MRQRTGVATKKLTVILEATLHNRVKRFALTNDVSLTELVVTALEERLAADSVK
jgi:predicted HicB family RNase H-like nuclease